MKKILILSSAALLALAVGCSDETTKKVSYTNQAGETVEFELKASEDKEMLRNALDFASQADYSKIEGLQVKGEGSIDFGYELNENNSASVSGSGSFDTRISNDGFSLNASGEFSEQQAQEVSTSMSQTPTKVTLKETGNADINMYYSVDDSKYMYGDVSYDVSSYLNGDKTASTNESAKEKVDASEYDLEDIFTNSTAGLDYVSGYIQEFTSAFSSTNFDTMVTALKEFSANSKLVVSSVTKNTFTIQVQLSVKDVATLVMDEMGPLLGIPSMSLTGFDDTYINLDFKFDVSTGLFTGISAEVNLKSYLNKVIETVYNMQGSNTSVDLPEITAAKVELSVNVSYSAVSIKKLTDSQKSAYIYMSSSQPDYTI